MNDLLRKAEENGMFSLPTLETVAHCGHVLLKGVRTTTSGSIYGVVRELS